MARIGIMQGRLVPPTEGRIQCFPNDRWRDEFPLAQEAGLACIEWIYDGHGAAVNPLATNAGVAEMKMLSEKHGVEVLSVCADWFMEMPLVRVPPAALAEREGKLAWLLDRGAAIGIQRMVLPFVDASRIEDGAEMDVVAGVLERALPRARSAGIEIHLETSLSPSRFTDLLRRIPAPEVKVNYDSGNSASLGFHPKDEFAAYGDRVGSVHIKDRVHGGATVPVGTGNTDFAALFAGLKAIGYRGDFILQAARSTTGDEVAWAARNRGFVEESWA